MDKKTMERIFEPFFTTKEMGRGTGLGLATAYGIIKGHGGIINVTSAQGFGTRFEIYLPASPLESKEADPILEKEIAIKGGETVLLVDDEEAVLTVSCEILSAMGYKVLPAKNGREAVETYTRFGDDIDVVILDMVMPDMSGGETFASLKAINPRIKVILSSGYSLNDQAESIMRQGCRAFIQKPFNLENLSQKLREILDGQS